MRVAASERGQKASFKVENGDKAEVTRQRSDLLATAFRDGHGLGRPTTARLTETRLQEASGESPLLHLFGLVVSKLRKIPAFLLS